MKNKYYVVYETWDVTIEAWGDTSYGTRGWEDFQNYKLAKKYAQDIANDGGISAIYCNNEGMLYFVSDDKYADELDNLALVWNIIKED